MLKQNKGKDLHKISKSKLKDGVYYTSIKYDGHYCQIIYDGISKVEFYTSGGKQFYLDGMAEYIIDNFYEPFHIECEFSYDCEGKLGDRGKSAILTTYRTEFMKNIHSVGDPSKDTFRVLDLLDEPDLTFYERFHKLSALFWNRPWFRVPHQHMCSLATAQEMAHTWVRQGYEGAMLKHMDHIYKPGKRTNDIIKLKPRLTADLRCTNVKGGTGKYEGMVGSLLLEDEDGINVWAGSGLSDAERSCDPSDFIGRVYEIEYERIDETYIQPIIKHRREDKE